MVDLSNVDVKEVLTSVGAKVYGNGIVSCPFHKDKNPSGKIYGNKYKCFSCGFYGDAIDIVREYYGISFKEAIKNLNVNVTQDSEYKKKNEERMKIHKLYRNRTLIITDYLCECSHIHKNGKWLTREQYILRDLCDYLFYIQSKEELIKESNNYINDIYTQLLKLRREN